MKAFTLSALSTLFAGLTLAHPVDLKARQGGGISEIDITILQFALTLEHLENEFYRSAFRTFTLQHFLDAGFDQDFFLNLQFIAADESAHVDFLSTAIASAGFAPVQPCQYNFPVTDIQSFVTLSAILESIGTSAYLGAAPFVGSKDILGIAASIMAVEGFHTSLQRSSIGAIGAPDPFATPLGPNSVFTLAAQFIVACPPSNPPLPFSAFPGLTISNQQTCLAENSFAGQGVNQVAQVSQGAWITQASEIATATATAELETGTENAAINTAEQAAVTEAAEATATEAAAETAVATETAEAAVTTEEAAATETAAETAAETAVATETAAPPPPPEKRDLAARQVSCGAPFAGTSVNLVPDFGASRHDFRNIRQVFVTIIAGLNVVSLPVGIGGNGIDFLIPTGIVGQVFIFITVVDITGRSLSDSDILFGPAIMEVAPQLPQLSF